MYIHYLIYKTLRAIIGLYFLSQSSFPDGYVITFQFYVFIKGLVLGLRSAV